MALYFNVTDAVGSASHHGITRVERKLAQQFCGRDEVRFVVIRHGRIGEIDHDAVGSLVDRAGPDLEPVIERFGIDPHPAGRLATSLRSSLGGRGAPVGLPAPPDTRLRDVDAGADDVFVSVGLDWAHRTLDHAERLVFGSGARYVGFCYDTIPIDHPEWVFPPDPLGFLAHVQRMARVAASIISISEWTRADLARHLPDYPTDRLSVLTLGADAAAVADPALDGFVSSIFGGAPYAIYCATIDRRKNHQLLYRAMREMVRRGLPGNVLFVGMPGSGVADLMSAMRNDSAVRGRIAHVTNCDDRHLAALYGGAAFAVYPSLYEGWGLGVTEAMAHRKACIVSSGSSLMEASLGRAIELPPLSTGRWVDAMAEQFARVGVAAAADDVVADDAAAVELPTWRAAAVAVLESAS